MIADGDSRLRNAFRVALLTATPEETPLPVNATQELDPGDILEVRDMAEAIARAEQIVAAPRSSRPRSSRRHANGVNGDGADLFETLGRRATRKTDDTAGPAAPLSASVGNAGTLLRPDSITRPSTPVLATPVSALRGMVISLPAPSIPVIAPATEDDAYFHPAGRIRGFADVTLDGYRPEPTLLVRAAARRKSFVWILAAALLPAVIVLVVVAILGRQDAANAAAVSTTTIATATIVTTPSPPSTPLLPAAAATAEPTPPSVPVIDVKSLPTAGVRSKSRR